MALRQLDPRSVHIRHYEEPRAEEDADIVFIPARDPGTVSDA